MVSGTYKDLLYILPQFDLTMYDLVFKEIQDTD